MRSRPRSHRSQGSARGTHSAYALRTDGTVWAWGMNTNGSLGGMPPQGYPVRVPGLTDIKSCQRGRILRLRHQERRNGLVLGRRRRGPSQVPSLSGITAVKGLSGSSLALKSDGTVWAWGSNNYGELGTGDMLRKPTPIRIPGLTGITDIASSSFYTGYALRNDGTVWAWGYNGVSDLGLGHTIAQPAPVQIPGLNNVLKISAWPGHPKLA